MGPATRRTRGRLLLALASAALVGGAVVGPPPAGADPTRFARDPDRWERDLSAIVRYAWPVDGPVLRGFEQPTTAYGAGHRGVDLDVGVGTAVRAAADGVVAFAGPVAGTTWVSIAHLDGVITSYGPIAASSVGRGDVVERGQPIGRLASGGHGHGDAGLHWGARRHGVYLDPRSLLSGGVARPSLIGVGGWHATGHAVTGYEPWGGQRWFGAGYHRSVIADAPGYARPPNPNHLLTIAGLGSSSSTVTIDPQHLGYDPRDHTALSYAGRTDDVGDPQDPGRDQLPYRSSDTWGGVEVASLRLRDQLRAQAAREPGRPVDLVGHSLGGVVILHYLANHHDAYDLSLPPIGHVVTVASPLHGSDVAALGAQMRSHRVHGPVVDVLHDRLVRSDGPVGRHVGPMPLDAPTVSDLLVGSPLLQRLSDDVDAALRDGPSGPLAMGTRVLTIGGGTDVVVGASRSSLPHGGAPDGQPGDAWPDVEHRVLPGGHQRVLQTEAVREVVWRFLAGEEVTQSPGYLSTGVSVVAGQRVDDARERLRVSDRLLAPLAPARDPP